MNGKCRRSPHRGHYWVEEVPESDHWACRWCGKVRHFNHERAEQLQMSDIAGAAEYLSQHWLCQQADLGFSGRLRGDSILQEVNAHFFLSPTDG